jgi:hypothetical protein
MKRDKVTTPAYQGLTAVAPVDVSDLLNFQAATTGYTAAWLAELAAAGCGYVVATMCWRRCVD